ncbi:hypothetical protein GCM10009775_15100 [Microbacterium aoyamense]|uniref:Uncharacterized protein n=1 Tax=Microbacterium aoyamense TaxID=344166 RepID=A0ABP5AVL4_9MICO|nr:hypothetical protein [Microbacterium aoyamense]
MTSRPEKRAAFEPAERLLAPTGYDPRMPRPATTTVACLLVLLRVGAGVLVLIALANNWTALLQDPDLIADGWDPSSDVAHYGLWVVLAIGGIVLLIDLLLAVFVYRGRNWARMFMMVVTVLSISSSFFTWWVQGQEIKIETTFVSLSIDILLLLALSSRSAAAYARRNEKQ